MQIGYVFAIHDVLKKEEKRKQQKKGLPPPLDIVYVGFARTPWVSIQRLILEPPNEAFKEYLGRVYQVYPGGLIIPGTEVLEIFFAERAHLPYDVLEPVGIGTEKKAYIEWSVLEEVSVGAAVAAYQESAEGRQVVGRSPKFKYIEALTNEGHELLNKLPGRPKGQKTVRPKVYASEEEA